MIFRNFLSQLHPINHIRRMPGGNWLLKQIDFPVMARLEHIQFPIAARLVQHGRLIFGVFEPEEQMNFVSLVKANGLRCFWDIGANIGQYSFNFISATPTAQVICFEPDQENVKLLNRTISRNCLSGVTVAPVCVSDTCGRSSFLADKVTGHTGRLDDEYSEAPFLVRHGLGSPEAVDITTTSIDHECNVHGQAPDVIKIDVEGVGIPGSMWR